MASNSKIILPNFPYEIDPLDQEENTEIFKNTNKSFQDYFVRIGPKRYLYNNYFIPLAPKIYNFEVRQDDVFVATFPKSGTTWVQELVWMIGNDLDYKTALEVPMPDRFPFLEYSMFLDNDRAREIIKEKCGDNETTKQLAKQLTIPATDILDNTPSPRYMKTHSPFSLLPPDTLDMTKVVYVARDPRDVAISYYYHHLAMPIYGYVGDFKSFWKLFKKGLIEWSPYFEHIKEAWELRSHPNVLFLFYEELSKDMPAMIRRVAKFLNKTVSEEDIPALCEHLTIDNFKKNKSLNYDLLKEIGVIGKGKDFLRKGKVGDWRLHFDDEMAKEAEQWIADNLRGTDIKFPQ